MDEKGTTSLVFKIAFCDETCEQWARQSLFAVPLNRHYGSPQANSGIPLYKKARSGPAQNGFCEIYAWYQPDQLVDLYTLPDHPCDKIIFLKQNHKQAAQLLQMHYLFGSAYFSNQHNPFSIGRSGSHS